MKANDAIDEAGGKPAEGEPVLLGITKSSIDGILYLGCILPRNHSSFTDASTLGKVDWLKGFKENVIMGHLIPAGTGSCLPSITHRYTRGQRWSKLSPEEACKACGRCCHPDT